MNELFYYYSSSVEETGCLAAELGSRIPPGSTIALDGDLGAGKTHFSQALAKAIGVPGIVNSPTFTIIKEYEGSQYPLYHMDVYRISMEEADELGLEEYFDGNGIALVEWASRIAPLLPAERLDIQIEVLDDGLRKVTLQPYGETYLDCCRSMKESGILL